MIKNILIIDDSRLIREALAQIFLKCGIKKSAISSVENARDAIDYFEFYSADLVVCGDNLVDMSVSKLLKQLISYENTGSFLSLILQSTNRIIGDVSFLEHDRYRVIQKPFNQKTLLTSLRSLTNQQLFTHEENKVISADKSAISPVQKKEQFTVLIVDDESSNIDVAAGFLRGTYRIIVAKSGKQALQVVNSQYDKIDLILLDIMMPEMDGFDVCRVIKNNSKSADIPVIFLTAKSEVSDITKGFALGAVDYITKPIQGEVLLARVSNHITLQQNRMALATQLKTLKENARLREDIEKLTQHDLKGPLSSILFEVDKVDNQQIAFAIKSSVNNVISMINNSLDVFKIEQGKYSFNPKPTDLTPIVTDAINAFLILAEKKNINIQVEGLDKTHLILAEPLLCLSIFNNLIKNAVEASPENNDVLVSITENVPHVIFTVENIGAIPLRIRDSLFEKYTSSDQAKGTGFGTYSAKLMTEVQKGNISFEIINEKSTLFTVEMPKAHISIHEN